VKYPGTSGSYETVGRLLCGRELRPGWRSAEMISDGRADPDGDVLIKRVGEHLLPPS
jgi:hypothetical protein